MRISFDLDDTLILTGRGKISEGDRFPAFIRFWLGEPLRAGACSLFRSLRRDRHEIWIYTSSGRTLMGIRFWLLRYGIQVDGVVNDERHRRALAGRRFPRLPSKYPPAFGIDLHVDDSLGVQMEGDTYGFRVVVVEPGDPDWVDKVLNESRTKLSR